MKKIGTEIRKHTILFGSIVMIYVCLILLLFWGNMRSYLAYMEEYRTINRLGAAYSDSRNYFHLYNKERNSSALEQYRGSNEEIRKIISSLAGEISRDRHGRMMSRVVGQMLDHRDEVIDAYISPDRINSRWGIDYIEELDLLLQSNLDLYTTACLDEISASYEHHAKQMRTRLVLLTLALLVSSMFVLWLNSRLFTRVIASIGKLTEATIQVRNKNFDDPDIEPDEYVEIDLVGQAFNDMKHTIREMIAEINRNFEIKERLTEQTLENERQKRYLAESKMKELQMQINPHFLFNSLSLVVRSIQLDEKDTSITLIQSISHILRSSIETSTLAIPLDEEIELLESYLLIQRIHCRGRIAIHLDVRKSYTEDDVKVPPLIIQPLVENAITHGLANATEDGQVDIAIAERQDYIEVSVRDNGCGISTEAMEALRDRRAGKSIGLLNVQERMQLFYHRDDVMQISTGPDGTQILLLFYKTGPAREKEAVKPGGDSI